MRLRETSAFIIVLLAVLVFGNVTPVSARTAPTVTGTHSINGGKVEYSVTRDGWRVYFTGKVTDTVSDGRCAYARLELVVTNGLNPDERTTDVCGRNSSRPFAGYLTAGKGHSIDAIKVKICINNNNYSRDNCVENSKTVPQHRQGSLSSSQFAWIDSLSTTSLSSFMRIQSNKPSPSIYDWREDGCSVPWYAELHTLIMQRVFKNACIRHDFGYKNYGKKYYRHTDSQRLKIDNQFKSDMVHICNTTPGLPVTIAVCLSSANVFYIGVRMGGGKHFAGQ